MRQVEEIYQLEVINYDTSRWPAAHAWLGRMKGVEHYEEVHRAYIEELMKAKPPLRYLQARER